MKMNNFHFPYQITGVNSEVIERNIIRKIKSKIRAGI